MTIVMIDGPEAAQYRTDIKGWVSRTGNYYGDTPSGERAARYDGCTHVPCRNCSAAIPKGYTICGNCSARKDAERYAAMPRAEWDGKAMLYSEAMDEFYQDLDAASDDLEFITTLKTLEELRLVICEPVYVRPLDIDYFADDLPEDGDLPEAVCEAMAAFNVVVRGIVLSWEPGKFALALPPSSREGVEP